MKSLRENELEIEQAIQRMANLDMRDISNHHISLQGILFERVFLARNYCTENEISRKRIYFQEIIILNNKIKEYLSII